MKTIPLNQLQNYLAYGLKCKVPFKNGWYNQPKTLTLGNASFASDNGWKPIVRPMSDLAKAEWNELCESNDFNFDRHNGWGTDLTKDGSTNHWNFKGNIELLAELFKHHFDVFGWLSDGLALDINQTDK